MDETYKIGLCCIVQAGFFCNFMQNSTYVNRADKTIIKYTDIDSNIVFAHLRNA